MPDHGRWTSNGGDPSLNEINRADRFLDALASKQPVYSTDPAEAELAFLFADWRDGVRDAPVTSPVTARDAVAALQDGLNTRPRSRRSFAIIGSVAAAVLCVGGFGAAIFGAGPGDPFYGVRTSLFGPEQATRDDQVALAAQTEMQQVQQLIDQGQWQEAQDRLVTLSTTVQSVDQVERKQELVEQWNALTYKVVEQDPAATIAPGEPLPVLPSSPLTWLPVPVVETPSSSESSSSETSDSSQSPDSSNPSESPTSSVTSGSSVPPTILLTPPPGESSVPATSPSAIPSVTPTTSAPTVAPSPSPSEAPSLPTTTTTTVRVDPPRSSAPPATPSPAAPAVPPSSVEVPPSQPRLAPSSPKPEVVVPPADVSIPAERVPSVPRSSTPAPTPQIEESQDVVTTTPVAPR